ncbi:DUF6778 family protein [Aestuariibius insulae]|uniref:DUF6778 family protein n=1 Tax=Aestuariibius insulae TaxID=2058287 RepID=UPI00345EB19D
MKLRTIVMMGAALLLAACSSTWVTRYDQSIDEATARSWSFRSVNVNVPQTLTVTDENRIAPEADIVWHGDAAGDRRAQVKAIMEAGLERGVAGVRGSKPVTLNVTVQRFHAVTPAAVARAPQAVHDIVYTAQVLDARTGAPITEPIAFRADLEAFTGEQAVQAAEQGQTQKVRIVNHLAAVTQGWLGIGPDQRRTFSSLGR